MTSGRDAGDAGADVLDDALVPEHHRQASGDLALHDVQVGVAQPGVRVPDQHLARARAVELDLLDLERAADLVQHGGGGPHGQVTAAAGS
jgi:hypothetical protein